LTTFLRNPRQAPTIFDLGGATAPRPKGAFYVRFKRGDFSQGPSYWERDIGFTVKTVDSPTISPKTEELNQYNKKRQVYTGYTTQPISLTLYDTADGMAVRMWDQYVRYYFGDFSQSAQNYKYDIVNFERNMLGDDIGYGYMPRTNDDINSQFFFDSIEIFQVFRNAYTKVTLLNPKITSFDTEEFDYEQFGPVMHRLQLSYEAVIYYNGGAPAAIDEDPILSETFRDIRLHGDYLEVSGPSAISTATNGTSQPGNDAGHNLFGGIGGMVDSFTGRESSGSARSGIGGVLGSFGNFNFGSAAGTAVKAVLSGRTSNLTSELAYSATGNKQLATILNMATTKQSPVSIAGQLVWGASQSGGLNPAVYDAAQAAVALAGGNKLAAGALGERVVQGVLATSAISGKPASAQVSSSGGFSMAPEVFQVVNAGRKALSQIGFKNPFGGG
jgi:hypothetical protein